jgi:hypothetical protein
MRPFVIFCVLVLSACSTLEKPEVINTSAIRVSSAQCGPTPAAKIELERLGERLRASALMQVTPTETVIVSFYSDQSGDRDWTVLIDSRNGRSCMVLWGKYWITAGQES